MIYKVIGELILAVVVLVILLWGTTIVDIVATRTLTPLINSASGTDRLALSVIKFILTNPAATFEAIAIWMLMVIGIVRKAGNSSSLNPH